MTVNSIDSGEKKTHANQIRVFSAREISGVSTKSLRVFLHGRVGRTVNSIARSISYTSTRTFGCMFMSFGLLSLFLHLFEYYFAKNPSVEPSSLIIGSVFSILSIPLVVFDKPASDALQDFPPTNYVLYEFFSIKRMRKNQSVKVITPFWGFIMGCIPAVVGFFLSLELVILILVIAVFVTVAFISPEFPLLFTLISLPYVTLLPKFEIVLAILSALTLLSFFRKVMLGKRVYYLEAYDVGIFILAAVFLLCGVIGGGSSSTANAWVMIALVLGYIPAGNLIVNRRLADCAANSIIFSAFPLSLSAIGEYIYSIVKGARTPSTSIFSSTEELSVFLLVSAIFTLFFAIEKKNKAGRVLYSLILIFNILALATTENILLPIVFILGALAFLVLNSSKIPNEMTILLALVPLLIFLLPTDALDKISEIFEIYPTLPARLSDFKESVSLFFDNLLFGIGANGFSGAESYPTFNLISGVACRFGIIALVIFLLMLLFRLRHLSLFTAFYKNSISGSLVNMSALSIFCICSLGMINDPFAYMSIFCLFWCVMGICSAALRISKSSVDDYVSYYRDLSSYDSADVSVVISNK